MMFRFFLILFSIGGLAAFQAQPPPETYWSGAGDTPPMTAYAQDGAYLRFWQGPILVMMPIDDATWQTALDEALRQLKAVIPIAYSPPTRQADIIISTLPNFIYERIAPCYAPAHPTDGCSWMIPLGHPDEATFDLVSHIWLPLEPQYPHRHVLLHELLHALGVQVHSPYPEDALYNGTDGAAEALSARDRATLQYLYSLPALGQ